MSSPSSPEPGRRRVALLGSTGSIGRQAVEVLAAHPAAFDVAALAAGKVVATANKETLVAGGHLVMPLARTLAATVAGRDPRDPDASPLAWLRPIDSEHSAI